MNRRDFLSSALCGTAAIAVGKAVAGKESVAPPACESNRGYVRMFPTLARCSTSLNPIVEEGLRKLGASMMDAGNSQSLESANILAGYTYFGQFIDHDLTLDITPLEAAHPNERDIQNFHTPVLDLDNVYAGGPTVSPFLYEQSNPPGNETFLVGMTGDSTFHGHVFKGSPNDLPRNDNGIGLTGDPRQDENLIIAQLHVAFLKFHNCVLQDFRKNADRKIESPGPPDASVFDQARRFVTWCYQYLVVNDFLGVVLDGEVFRNLDKTNSALSISVNGTAGVPIEFTAAAFRFGHSMVRDRYSFLSEKHDDVELPCLLALTGPRSDALRKQEGPCREHFDNPFPPTGRFILPADWRIKWSAFFSTNPHNKSRNHARKIDTAIAEALHHLDAKTVKQFNAFMAPKAKSAGDDHQPPPIAEPQLPIRTLLRGGRMGLPSGQDVAKALGITQTVTNDEILQGLTDDLRPWEFHKDTPLWYYVLKEAEVCNSGEKLGPVGSRIVGDSILAVLRSDPSSYLSASPSWRPKISKRDISKVIQVLNFVDECERLP